MFVSVTRLRIRRLWDMPAFAMQALRSALQAKAATGNVSVVLLAEARRTFWTRTIWIEESAMRAFMLGEPHRNHEQACGMVRRGGGRVGRRTRPNRRPGKTRSSACSARPQASLTAPVDRGASAV